MYRGALVMLIAATTAVQADDGDLAAALAVQKAVQAAIDQAEPAIACVLVSRSSQYRTVFGDAPPPDFPGRLGGFDPVPFGRTQPEKQQLARRLNLADPANVPEYFGSGVVIDPAGLVLTNFHVVRDATKIFVRLPGRKGSYADIHAADARSDLAILKLLAPPSGLRALPFGDGGNARKGQMVIALANPYAAGFQDGSPSASWGVISNLRRRAPSSLREEERTRTLHHYGTLLQTDARLNLGSSGGALLNLNGELIGLTTALAALSGSEVSGGYALPLDTNLRRIIEVLRRGEEVEYGFLGVSLDALSQRGDGARLANVTPRSPAQRAGLRSGDVILEVNGTRIRELDDLFLSIGALLAGTEAELQVASTAGKVRRVRVPLAKFHHPGPTIASNRRAPVRGLRVDYTSLLMQMGIVQDIPEGVLVREVVPGSPADRVEQLKVNDIITEVNGDPVNTPAEFYRAAERSAGPLTLTLHDPDRKVRLP